MIKRIKAIDKIYELYDKYELDKEEIIDKTKYILSIYRQTVWATTNRSEEMKDRVSDMFGESISTALTYLSEFAPYDAKAEFEEQVAKIFKAKWMVEIIDDAMAAIFTYPINGKIYFEILSRYYLTAKQYTEDEMLELLDINRSTYYRKRKEAIALLGSQLWGYALPHLIENERKSKEINVPFLGTAYAND